MPMHDWTRVRSGVFHNFHVLWISTITNRLNSGLLPRGYLAMAEQVVGGPEPDVVALQFNDFERLNSGETGRSGGLAVVDAVALVPPGPRDPQGIHKAIWDLVTDQSFELPADRQITIAAYQALPIKTAYIEPIALGSLLPDMPLFLHCDFYVQAPLEMTYMDTWNVLPQTLRDLVLQ